MRTRSILLSKTCPYCGARSRAEAKLPIPANSPAIEMNLDHLAALVEKQSLSMLLALVELLPYKTFACAKCGAEFRLESRSGKELVGAMLGSMQPALPHPASAVGANFKPGRPRPAKVAPVAPPEHGKDWESESLDALFDYSTDAKPKA
jgi:DNA-directed RNA polymerase subunit RPC12/RpoP